MPLSQRTDPEAVFQVQYNVMDRNLVLVLPANDRQSVDDHRGDHGDRARIVRSYRCIQGNLSINHGRFSKNRRPNE